LKDTFIRCRRSALLIGAFVADNDGCAGNDGVVRITHSARDASRIGLRKYGNLKYQQRCEGDT
jgi:hypothetical protein